MSRRRPSSQRARVGRPPRHLAGLLLVVALLLVSCGGDEAKDLTVTQLVSKGLQAHQAGDTQEASSHYQQVLKKDPGNKYAHYNLGLIDQQANRLADAEDRYRKALKSDPDFTPALFNLAIVRTGPDPQEAHDLYRHVIRINPQDASSHLNLGFLLISMGRKDEGDAELKLAVQIDPRLASRLASPLPPAAGG